MTFGRVVTATAVRGQGFGDQLVTKILDLCLDKWPNREIKIEAQEQVTGFYAKYGFQPVGEPFIFEGTPHLEMVK
ncbi:GNAT family acetyltransferase [Fructobacillus ficulneus]|uniref:GNAT family acetyltransferase n=1 Tax=Fructobacillus ficulneus TaxID=157463 RepID=A0A0K8MGD4_9LACO|nr:GNAT family acetyltransferase [Fructobacillus ficulneus]